MPNPFPGIDPYLESQRDWQDFHSRFITYSCDALADQLPGDYVARIEEQILLVRATEELSPLFRPDLALLKDKGSVSGPGASQSSGTATLEPVTIPFKTHSLTERRETWVEIIHLPEHTLVTVMELLSPSNKLGAGGEQYLAKREEYIRQPVHLVELDFLLGGHRLPMRRPLPPGDFFAFVGRSDRRPDCDVYSWTIRQALPTIPIPLAVPDADLKLDLAEIVAQCYARGRYERTIDYTVPLTVPLDEEDRAWAEALAKGAA